MSAEVVKIRRGRKYDQVINGARSVFLTDGFEGASVDEIARVAGVSKATLYSYFPDKRILFMEMVTQQCQAQATTTIQSLDLTAPPDEVLRKGGQQFLGFLLSDMGQRIFRIVIAECERFPELGQKFYESGPMVMRRALVDYLAAAQNRGQIRDNVDIALAADQFGEMCKADLWLKVIVGIRSDVSQADISRVVDGAVDTFLARYGA